MPAYVVIELASSRQRSARREASPLEGSAVQRLVARHGGTVLPASPPPDDAADPTTFATIAVPDMAHARDLAEALRDVAGVASAYAKPGDELP